jgi:hypothetical protein
MDADLDTLATALYVRTDDLLKAWPERAPWRPKIGIDPKISDAELITLTVMQALLGHTSEACWLRYTAPHLHHLFRYLPQQPGYNKRLRRLGATIGWLVGVLARDTTLWTDDVWVVDSTPSSAPARARQWPARTWPDGPSTATAPATPGSSRDCGCICCARCTGCPSGSL